MFASLRISPRGSEPVHRQLRTALPSGYADKMKRVFAGGARMCVAVDGKDVAGVAVYRVYENTFQGRQLYVDDLVTDERRRSSGVGRALLGYLEQKARAAGLDNLALDSGTQRQQEFAHANTGAAFEFAQKLSSVKSPSEFFELSTSHSRRQLETLTEQTKELTALAQKITLATAEPFKTGANKTFSQLS